MSANGEISDDDLDVAIGRLARGECLAAERKRSSEDLA
jgi:hypothetical protein